MTIINSNNIEHEAICTISGVKANADRYSVCFICTDDSTCTLSHSGGRMHLEPVWSTQCEENLNSCKQLLQITNLTLPYLSLI